MQNDGKKYVALVNTVEDEAAKQSSTYSFAQLQFFNHVVRNAITDQLGLQCAHCTCIHRMVGTSQVLSLGSPTIGQQISSKICPCTLSGGAHCSGAKRDTGSVQHTKPHSIEFGHHRGNPDVTADAGAACGSHFQASAV